MRDAFFSELNRMFVKDQRMIFITGDLGYKLFDPLKRHDARRVINAGIREGAMIGYASGLAREGYLPVVYSIVPFLTLRCLEQIKIDLCYGCCPVLLAGVGGGYSYGPNGPTHYGIDDIGPLSALPNMSVWTPSDPSDVTRFVRTIPDLQGPAYLRLGRTGESCLYGNQTPPLEEPFMFGDSRDGHIVTCGFLTSEALKARDILLEEYGLSVGVVRLATMRPFPAAHLVTILASSDKPLLSVEEHVAAGGLGQTLAVLLLESGFCGRFRMLAATDSFPDACYSRETLLRISGIDAEGIAKAFREVNG